MEAVDITTANEATLMDTQEHWRGEYRRHTDAGMRVIALCELQRIENEVAARRDLGLWRTGAYPGVSKFKEIQGAKDGD